VARIRTIKPEFWSDEKIALLDPITRLVYLALISLADDYGRLIDNVKSLDGTIFPHTDESCADSLDTLASLQRILRYTAKSGQHLIQIVRWEDHQKVNHPGKEVLPAPTSEDLLKPVPKKSSSESPEKGKRAARKSLASYLGPRTKDLGSTTIPADAGKIKSWPAEASEFWSAKVTPIDPPRCGRTLKAVVDAHGWDTTKAALEKFVSGQPDWKSPRLDVFANEANKWVRFVGMKTNDEMGDLTEWGRHLEEISSGPRRIA
jgi:hypothetical protein